MGSTSFRFNEIRNWVNMFGNYVSDNEGFLKKMLYPAIERDKHPPEPPVRPVRIFRSECAECAPSYTNVCLSNFKIHSEIHQDENCTDGTEDVQDKYTTVPYLYLRVIYFHGNAEDIYSVGSKLEFIANNMLSSVESVFEAHETEKRKVVVEAVCYEYKNYGPDQHGNFVMESTCTLKHDKSQTALNEASTARKIEEHYNNLGSSKAEHVLYIFWGYSLGCAALFRTLNVLVYESQDLCMLFEQTPPVVIAQAPFKDTLTWFNLRNPFKNIIGDIENVPEELKISPLLDCSNIRKYGRPIYVSVMFADKDDICPVFDEIRASSDETYIIKGDHNTFLHIETVKITINRIIGILLMQNKDLF